MPALFPPGTLLIRVGFRRYWPEKKNHRTGSAQRFFTGSKNHLDQERFAPPFWAEGKRTSVAMAPARFPDPRTPVVGTRLIREWDGIEHTITVLKQGFEWQGRRYKSLSAIARAITGTRWNGIRFFGLSGSKRWAK